jgi:hypothetical protein
VTWLQSAVSGTTVHDAEQFAETDFRDRDRQRRGIAKAGARSYVLVAAGTGGVDLTAVGDMDPRISAVNKDNIVEFMYDAARRNGERFGVNASQLAVLWGTGTAATPERTHLREAFYQREPKRHEWIPRDQIQATVRRASSLNDEKEAAKIIHFHDSARSPTYRLVFKPDERSSELSVDGLSLQTMNGHPGAVRAIGPEGTTRNCEGFNTTASGSARA